MTTPRKPKKPKQPAKPAKPIRPKPGTEPSRNGVPLPPAFGPVDQLPPEPTITPTADPYIVESSDPPPIGRLASSIQPECWSWLVEDMIPLGCLSFICGHPEAGKSCFAAWLAGQARATVILPGLEESVSLHLIPRLESAGVELQTVVVLDDQRYRIPDDLPTIGRACMSVGANLLLVDPIDSYIEIESENDGTAVRGVLEPLATLAAKLGIAVVCVRHPGKARGNVCPGSRQWLAVPRVVIELLGTVRTQRRPILRVRKGPQRCRVGPRAYALVTDVGDVPRFRLGMNAAEIEAELLQEDDFCRQLEIDRAIDLIPGVLDGDEQPIAVLRAAAERDGISERTLQMALQRLGCLHRRFGSGAQHTAFWREAGTPAGTGAERHTLPPHERAARAARAQ
jgi:hypothetical protein